MRVARNTAERWDPIGSRFYRLPIDAGLPRVRPMIQRYRHRCPDGTVVEASAQFIPVLGRTVYRLSCRGEPVTEYAVPGPNSVDPDWSLVDRSVPAGAVSGRRGVPRRPRRRHYSWQTEHPPL